MATLTFTGLLSLHSHGEADGILFMSDHSDPVAECVGDKVSGEQVTVRYWTTDVRCSKQQAMVGAVLSMSGSGHADFGARYSEMTGYLWTDEELKIGGHDLLSELKSKVGRWIILEVDIHSK